jgi:hypothetical protein
MSTIVAGDGWDLEGDGELKKEGRWRSFGTRKFNEGA